MKATVKFNGKKYIYTLDGIQIRASIKPYAYDYVAILTINGEFRDIMAMGKFNTCKAVVTSHDLGIKELTNRIACLKKVISYSEYYNRVGSYRAFTRSYFAKEIAKYGDNAGDYELGCLKAKKTEKIEIIKIEQA